MPVLALGVSHRLARVELLERLAVPGEELPKAYRRMMDLEPVTEAVILSTCNRVEVYAEVSTYHAGFMALKRFLAETGEMDPDLFAEPLYAHYEDDAVEHLFAVAAGMDSMVIGEPQIMGQVRAAFRTAAFEGAAGPALEPLFRAAVRTGRRVRSETAIGAAPEAMVVSGLDLAESELGGLAGRTATVVGAGQMAAIAVRVLRDRGVSRVGIVNRSAERAAALAERHGGEPHGLPAIRKALAGAEVVVACTGAAGVVVRVEDIREAIAASATVRRMFVLDLAVPRDVDPGVGALPGVSLADVDDLAGTLVRGAEVRASLRDGAAIVGQEVARFAARRRAARLAPLIEALRARGDRIREAELAAVMAKLDLAPDERAAVEAMSRAIVAKLLHEPIVRVKELSGPGGGSVPGPGPGDHHARALADLFGLEYRPGP
jgi:glutamyl-tRNA reductase